MNPTPNTTGLREQEALADVVRKRLSWASLHWFPTRSRGGIKSPVIADEIAPEIAKAILASDWLAAREVEAGRQALRDAADDIAAWDTRSGDVAQADVEVFLRDRADGLGGAQ